jgi:hypothetical protein
MQKRKNKTEGWKAPTTFAEYVEMNPNGNVRWLRSHYSPNAPDFDDIGQELLVEIAQKKVVEKYDPKGFVDSTDLFFNWIGVNYDYALKRILGRRKTHKRSVNSNTLSLDAMLNKHGEPMNSDDIMLSESYQHLCELEGERVFTSIRIAEFRNFIKKHRPSIIPALDRFLSGHENREEFRILAPKLRVLAKHFKRGTVPSKSAWKKYRKRKNAAQKRYYRRHREKILAWFKAHSADEAVR